MSAYDICKKAAIKMACSKYSWYNPSFERMPDGELVLIDRQGTPRPNDHQMYIIDDNNSRTAQEIWDDLTEEEQNQFEVYAYAAFLAFSEEPLEEMYASIWEDYIKDK